ncbi:NAD(P)/FAD-dependent oxidoreductase [Actinophytocola gossypii]|uniref:FAD-dependent oxidoreductase n=1 Tax=Actinophytocola gossypii TaxID=2812003 RepID=A0ABT2JA12_9PSEU|nr:FAD/NAD(P)-binding oxidoreductase [Actinophytocola gossypii]MCT2584546.1 FAD-dependent oxidoreductase [Actinophytocola gossypii]
MPARIVVVGASLGGLRAAEQLRAAGWTAEIVVVGAEPHMPYNRPPLSKEVLAGTALAGSVMLRQRPSVADAVWLLGSPASTVDLDARAVTLADGTTLDFDGLVVATGLRPRRLTDDGHVLRTLDDAIRLHTALTARPGTRLVVVGAGFVGCEVAATARRLGADVAVVDPLPLPMVGPLGEQLAAALLTRHEERGARFHLGRTVTRFERHQVVLDDGTVLPADVVVEAVGSRPNTEWLNGNGLDLSDGVLCDEHLRVEGLPFAVAVGDVARFPNARYDSTPRRVEHWSIPGDTAKHAARTLVASLTGAAVDQPAFAPLPTFWSDQYGQRLQAIGAPQLGTDDIRILEGDLHGDVIVGYHRDSRLVGVVGLGRARATAATARYRMVLSETGKRIATDAGSRLGHHTRLGQ